MHGKWEAAQADSRSCAARQLHRLSLFVSRLVASVDKSLPPSRLRSGIEKGFSIRNCESWTLHKDVCQALWFRRVKAEKRLAEIEPHGAFGAAQFFLCSQEQKPHTPFS